MKSRLDELMPFGQQVRKGNFKLWRGQHRVKTSDGTDNITCVYVSDLSGAWCIRIPETYEMYSLVCRSVIDSFDGDAVTKKSADAVFSLILSNMMFCSVVGNGYFQRGVEMIAMLYANPDVLDKGNDLYKEFMRDVKETVGDFRKWAAEYRSKTQEYEPTEEEMHQEDLADEAADIVSKED